MKAELTKSGRKCEHSDLKPIGLHTNSPPPPKKDFTETHCNQTVKNKKQR